MSDLIPYKEKYDHQYLLKCAAGWEPDARILGNMRADDIVSVCLNFEILLQENQRLQAYIKELESEKVNR